MSRSHAQRQAMLVLRSQRVLGVALSLLLFAAAANAKSHQVQRGDSLWALAKRYGVSVSALQKANGMGSAEKIKAGQRLKIPEFQAVQKRSNPSAKTKGRTERHSRRSSTKKVKNATRAANGAKSSAVTKSKKSTPASNKSEKVAARTARSSAPATRKKAKARKPKLAERKGTAVRPKKPKNRRRAELEKSRRGAGTRSKSAKTKSTKAPALDRKRPGKVFSHVSREARERAERLYSSSELKTESTLGEIAPKWVLSSPAESTQGEKSNASRGGVFPCAAPDPGFSGYKKWTQVAPMAHVLAPVNGGVNPDGTFNVLFHFHGREPIRKEWVQAMEDATLVAVDVGIDSSSYAETFSDPRTFRQVVRAVEDEAARRSGNPKARATRIGLSAWSAGYGAIEQLLTQPYAQKAVDSVVLLDGLHVGYEGHSLDQKRMAPFVRFAKEAANQKRFMFVSHSSIRTRGYASTTETANYLTWRVGGKPRGTTASDADPMGLERISVFSLGGFHVRGFRGSGMADHCAHIGLMRDIARVHLLPRWQVTPERETPGTPAVAQFQR